jgi:hypothetical protein
MRMNLPTLESLWEVYARLDKVFTMTLSNWEGYREMRTMTKQILRD